MKVIFVNAYYSKGGAARAALRLADALRYRGVEVEYISVYSSEMSFFEKMRYLIRVCYDRLPGFILAKKRVMFSSGGFSNNKLVSYINSSDADVVHFHWVNAGCISIADVFKISKPVFWSLHDMWPLTGGCHYSFDCLGLMKTCGSCPQLHSTKKRDISFNLLARKVAFFQKARGITLLGVSNWISSVARESTVAAKAAVMTLPNAIDTNLFFPEHKSEARIKLGLGSSAKIILFGAAAATTDVRKGFSELCRALISLPACLDYQLVVFGADKLEGLPEIGMPVFFLGHVSDDSVLRSIYSAADVMVVPSRQETFGLTAAEAMACGTPVVCFGITGLLDIVDHKVNGFTAKPYDSSDLAVGISWVLENSADINFAVETRNKILSSFSYKVVADSCLSIYNERINLKEERL